MIDEINTWMLQNPNIGWAFTGILFGLYIDKFLKAIWGSLTKANIKR